MCFSNRFIPSLEWNARCSTCMETSKYLLNGQMSSQHRQLSGYLQQKEHPWAGKLPRETSFKPITEKLKYRAKTSHLKMTGLENKPESHALIRGEKGSMAPVRDRRRHRFQLHRQCGAIRRLHCSMTLHAAQLWFTVSSILWNFLLSIGSTSV